MIYELEFARAILRVTADPAHLVRAPRSATTFKWPRQARETRSSVQVQKSLPRGPGWGYRVEGRTGNGQQWAGQLGYKSDVGVCEVGLQRRHGLTDGDIAFSGGLAFLGGRVAMSRPIRNAFALIRASEVSGVA